MTRLSELERFEAKFVDRGPDLCWEWTAFKNPGGYGTFSALEPIRAFSKLNPVEQLLIRIDDKISRLQKGDGTGDEDAEADTLGYLILLAIARKDANA